MEQALSAYQRDDLGESERLCRLVLDIEADYFDALQVLGIILARGCRYDESQEVLSRAVAVNPQGASVHSNRGNVLQALRRFEEAVASYDRAIAIRPDHVEAHSNRGAALGELGRHEEALASYESAIQFKPDYAEAWSNRGNTLGHLQRHEDAVGSYDLAVTIKPDYAEAWSYRGSALQELKCLEAALASFERAIAINPGRAEIHNSCGAVLAELKRHAEALASYERVVEISPGYGNAHYNRGNTLLELKRYEEALGSYDRALEIMPDYADAWCNRGNALKQLDRFEEAVASYDRATAIDSEYADPWSNRGSALQSLRRFDEALDSFDRAIRINSAYADAYYNRGNLLGELKRFEEAVESFDRVIEIDPDHPEAYNNRGVALNELHRPEEAVANYEQALIVRPDYVDAHYNRGNALKTLRRFDEALVSYDRAIEIKPDYAGAHWNLALFRLLLGDFIHGWAGYEWRWKTEQMEQDRRDFLQPLWLGEESLAGATILLHAEQGMGDTLQFCRYVKLVAGLGAKVVLEVQAPLLALLGHMEGASVVLANGSTLPRFDWHCPLLSLPLALKSELKSIPTDIPYLRSDAGRVAKWRERLGKKTKPRVGLVWSGNPQHRNDHNRSVALAQLLPLFALDAEYVSLQKNVAETDADLLGAYKELRHFGAELNDFADTAALVELMDVVISVDTSVAHLAGAMGKAVWILLPYSPDWRWLLDREDSPWYPTARLFRQEASGSWGDVIERVAKALRSKFVGNTEPVVAGTGRNDDGSATLNLTQTMESALSAYQRGDLAEAERMCRLALEFDADYFDALQVLGVVALQRRELPGALDHLSRAVSIDPSIAGCHGNRATVLYELKRYEEAVAGYDNALEIDP
jgi:tetratricopeptide (TPR) repeat protein